MEYFKTAEDHAIELARTFSCRTRICPCMSCVTCEIVHCQVKLMSHDYVILTGEVFRDGAFCADDYPGFSSSFLPKRCAHDIEARIQIRVTSDQWQHVVCKSSRFLVLQARFFDGCLDTTAKPAGIMASFDSRIEMPGSDLVTCEIFSGGFSGWSHAMRKLSELGYPFAHKIAVDIEPQAAEAFMRSHGFHVSLGPETYVWGTDDLPDKIFIEGDVTCHSWKHLFSNAAYDLMCMSPPCPPWSFASMQQGLGKLEGRLTLHAWGLARLLRPRIVLMDG